MLNIDLEVRNQKSIESGLKKFVEPDIISDYNCEACGKKVDLEKRNSVSELPNTLILHLQRIVFDMDTFKNVKLNDRIEFPERLNMKAYTTKMTSDSGKKQDNENEAMAG